MNPTTKYVGSVIGNTYEWNKGAEQPYIKVRDIASGELVRCNYLRADYAKVAKMFEHQDVLVAVYGTITFDRLTSKTEITRANDFEVMPTLSDEEFEKFFGSAPDLAPRKSAAEFIRDGRNNDD